MEGGMEPVGTRVNHLGRLWERLWKGPVITVLLGTGGEASVYSVSVPLMRDGVLVHIQLALKVAARMSHDSFERQCEVWAYSHAACSMFVMPLLAEGWLAGRRLQPQKPD